uniref:Reverse transcriptase domain-containing protein n=1 Tax=Knipowitschia caucasica TaxID=637954 RepID=A0AAV2J8S3_KNICA
MGVLRTTPRNFGQALSESVNLYLHLLPSFLLLLRFFIPTLAQVRLEPAPPPSESLSGVISGSAGFGTFFGPILVLHNTDGCVLQKFSDDSAIIGLSSEDDNAEYRGVIQDFVDWCQRNHLLINAGKTKEMNPLLINAKKTKEMNHLLINVRKTKEMNHLLINAGKTKEMNHLLINVGKTKEMNHLLINAGKTKEMNHLLINAEKTKEMNHLLINAGKTKEMARPPLLAFSVSSLCSISAESLKLKSLATEVGIPLNCIMALKNYSEGEMKNNPDMDTLILTALKHIVQFGDDFIEEMTDTANGI